MLKVWLQIDPMAKERHRCTCRPAGLKCKACGQARSVPGTYSDKTAERWEQQVTAMVRASARASGIERLNGPVRIRVDFVRARTASMPAPDAGKRREGHWYTTKEAWATGARIPAPTKPDVDNLMKSLMDAINHAGLWWDDAQVVEVVGRKWYGAEGEKPGIMLTISGI